MKDSNHSLEAFVERHRADLDAFEPRPDLWAALEHQLEAPAATAEPAAPLRAVPLPATDFAPAALGRRHALAAAVAAVLVLGAGYFWTTDQRGAARPQGPAATAPLARTAPVPTSPVNNDLALYLGQLPLATLAADAPGQQLSGAVQRMETYYATQIGERQTELRRLERETAATPDAEWRQELRGLDSTYRQLRVELYRNPEPDVVLDAMNRNLQIRLDILNQQLRVRERMQEYGADSYILAERGHRNP